MQMVIFDGTHEVKAFPDSEDEDGFVIMVRPCSATPDGFADTPVGDWGEVRDAEKDRCCFDLIQRMVGHPKGD